MTKDKSWINEWDLEQHKLLNKYVKSNSDIISIPMREYLKTIAYKSQIVAFMQQINAICKEGGYEYKDVVARFSNSFLEDLMLGGVTQAMSPNLSRMQSSLFYKAKENTEATDATPFSRLVQKLM